MRSQWWFPPNQFISFTSRCKAKHMKSFNSVIILITDKCPHQQNSKLLSSAFLLAPFCNPFTSLRGCASESIKTRWQQLLETLTCILHPALESTKMLTAWQPDGETCTRQEAQCNKMAPIARSDISEGTAEHRALPR